MGYILACRDEIDIADLADSDPESHEVALTADRLQPSDRFPYNIHRLRLLLEPLPCSCSLAARLLPSGGQRVARRPTAIGAKNRLAKCALGFDGVWSVRVAAFCRALSTASRGRRHLSNDEIRIETSCIDAKLYNALLRVVKLRK